MALNLKNMHKTVEWFPMIVKIIFRANHKRLLNTENKLRVAGGGGEGLNR